MAFGVKGDVLIACNCDWGCPCNFNARPTRGFCQGGWIWMIEKGEADGIAVDGLGICVFAKWPGAIRSSAMCGALVCSWAWSCCVAAARLRARRMRRSV